MAVPGAESGASFLAPSVYVELISPVHSLASGLERERTRKAGGLFWRRLRVVELCDLGGQGHPCA